MTEIEKNKLAMYESVLLFLSENKDIINTIRAFNWSIAKLKKVICEIRLKEKVLSGEVLENTIRIAKSKDELLLTLRQISIRLFNLASEINDTELKQKCRLTQNSLFHLLDFEIMDKANSTLIVAHKYLYKSKKYNISFSERKELRKDVEELRKNIQNFSEALHSKMASYVSGNTIMTISLLFAECDKILSSYIDNFVEALAESYPYFHDEYIWMRNIENQNEIRTLMEIEEH